MYVDSFTGRGEYVIVLNYHLSAALAYCPSHAARD